MRRLEPWTRFYKQDVQPELVFGDEGTVSEGPESLCIDENYREKLFVLIKQ